MREIQHGKWTHDHDGEVVVFLVGMRINQPLRVRTWWPSFSAFPKMVRELYAQPELGFLGASTTINGRGALAVTYWKDLPSLLAYAHHPDHEHRPAWGRFNRLARAAQGAVGIWHETFVVPPAGTSPCTSTCRVRGSSPRCRARRLRPAPGTPASGCSGRRRPRTRPPTTDPADAAESLRPADRVGDRSSAPGSAPAS